MATLLGPAVYSPGLPEIVEDDPLNPDLFVDLERMTAEQFDQMLDEGFELDSYSNGALHSNPPSDTGNSPVSPGRMRSSAEPDDDSHILTPSTSTLDYHGDIQLTENPEAAHSISTSPGTNVTHISKDYVHVPGRFSGQPGGVHNATATRPTRASAPGTQMVDQTRSKSDNSSKETKNHRALARAVARWTDGHKYHAASISKITANRTISQDAAGSKDTRQRRILAGTAVLAARKCPPRFNRAC
jgi:hypothetical protein